jgi:hypothetical protein
MGRSHVNARVDIAMTRRVTPAKGPFRVLWNIARAPVLVVLLLCEPIVRFVCAGSVVLGVFAAVVLKVSAIGSHFSLVAMIAFAGGFGVALILYYGLVALFLE